MATYKYSQYLMHANRAAFDTDHQPGDASPHPGIYRCVGCGREILAEEKSEFPPRHHHQHTAAQGLIRWRLIVYAEREEKK